MAVIFGRIISSFMTEKMLSRVIIEVLKVLAARTTNTVDDDVVNVLAKNLNM